MIKLQDAFSTLRTDSVERKLNRLNVKNTLHTPNLKERIEKLTDQLDTYTQDTSSLIKLMIREQMDPDFIKGFQEDVELSQQLKKSLIHAALTEEGFKKHLDIFIQATHGGTLRNLLIDAKRPPEKAAPPQNRKP